MSTHTTYRQHTTVEKYCTYELTIYPELCRCLACAIFITLGTSACLGFNIRILRVSIRTTVWSLNMIKSNLSTCWRWFQLTLLILQSWPENNRCFRLILYLFSQSVSVNQERSTYGRREVVPGYALKIILWQWKATYVS